MKTPALAETGAATILNPGFFLASRPAGPPGLPRPESLRLPRLRTGAVRPPPSRPARTAPSLSRRVNPARAEIDGQRVCNRLGDIPEPLHAVTRHVSPARSAGLAEALLAARPARVLFNPGAENPELATKLGAAGIDVVRAGTRVRLRTGRFWLHPRFRRAIFWRR